MTNIIITTIVGLTTTIISSWTTYFFTRKKYNSEVDNNLINNMKDSLEFYTNLSDDNSKRLQEILEDYNKLREQFEVVLSENNSLRIEVIKLRTQISSLSKELKKFNDGTKIK